MNTQESPRTIDNGLFQLYTDIQLRDVENDVTMSLSEKEQLKAILMSFKEIDGNVLYSIFQEVFENSMRHRTVNDQESLVAYTESIEREVLDTAITESITVDPESHQTDSSTAEHITPSTERISRTIKFLPVITTFLPATTRSQAKLIENHTASAEDYLEPTEHRSPSTGKNNKLAEDGATMNSTLAAVNGALALERNTTYKRNYKFPRTLTLLANVEAIEKPINKILLASPRKEIQLIKAHPQRSSAVFRARMNAANEPKTAKEKAFLETFDVRDVMQIYKKPLNEFISLLSHGHHQSQLDKCRQMLCAYQIGKITNELMRAASHEDKELLERNLFRHLNVTIRKNNIFYNSFTGLCVNSLHLVEHVGVHALFAPEVISPAVLKQLDASSLLSLAKHLNKEWPSQFKKLARLTYYGEVVVSRSPSNDTMSENTEFYPGQFLKNK